MGTVNFVVPVTPCSVNHYVKHTRSGRHYVTAEAEAFIEAVWVWRGKNRIRAAGYLVEAVIYLGKGKRGDVDNFGKLILDALVKAEVIDTDAKVTDLILRKRRDRRNERTEITVIGV